MPKRRIVKPIIPAELIVTEVEAPVETPELVVEAPPVAPEPQPVTTSVPSIKVPVKVLGVGTDFWLNDKQYTLVKVSIPTGMTTIISKESGKESTILNYTTVSV